MPPAETLRYLIQGASRGIGLALTEQVLKGNPSALIAATCRGPIESLDNLCQLRDQHGERLHLFTLDVESETSIQDAYNQAATKFRTFDRIINVAGILHDGDLTPEKRLTDISPEHFEKVMRVNTLGPLLVAKWFSALMSKEEQSQYINISARVGSISDNYLGGWYSYRASKAALNMITRNLSIELKRKLPKVICAAIHPGTTDTGLSKPFQRNVPASRLSTSLETAVKILGVMDGLDYHHNGSFLSADGVPIPW